MDFRFVDLGIAIGDTLVIADLHLGIEESIFSQGVLIPKTHMKQIEKRIKWMIRQANPKRIIINGDLKDDYSEVSDQEWRDIRQFLSWLKGHAIVFVRGNHDTGLDRIGKKFGVPVVEDVETDGFFITHGDKLKPIPKTCHTIIIGHEHAAVSLREGARVEKYKSFLVSEYEEKRLIMLPSLNPLAEGHDVMAETPLSPYLTNPPSAHAYIVAEPGKVLDFGELKKLKEKGKT